MKLATVISELYIHQNDKALIKLKEDLEKQRSELEVFFDEFLDLFDDKMNATEGQNTKEWKAYKAMYKEYEDVKENLNLINYYAGK